MIRAPQLRVIGSDGKQVGVLSRDEALALAREAQTDLVEIAPQAEPPVAKIIDFGKFRYAEEKKLKQQKKGSKSADLKEIRFSPFIGQGDFDTRIARISEFLDNGAKVRLVVVFRKRQMGSRTFGYTVLKRVYEKLEGRISIDVEPKFAGLYLSSVISPLKKGKKTKESNEQTENT